MPHPQAPLLDPSRCPLCGGDNGCAMARRQAAGTPQPPCWCVSARFSPTLLAQLPAGALNAACICARCVANDAAAHAHNAPSA